MIVVVVVVIVVLLALVDVAAGLSRLDLQPQAEYPCDGFGGFERQRDTSAKLSAQTRRHDAESGAADDLGHRQTGRDLVLLELLSDGLHRVDDAQYASCGQCTFTHRTASAW